MRNEIKAISVWGKEEEESIKKPSLSREQATAAAFKGIPKTLSLSFSSILEFHILVPPPPPFCLQRGFSKKSFLTTSLTMWNCSTGMLNCPLPSPQLANFGIGEGRGEGRTTPCCKAKTVGGVLFFLSLFSVSRFCTLEGAKKKSAKPVFPFFPESN